MNEKHTLQALQATSQEERKQYTAGSMILPITARKHTPLGRIIAEHACRAAKASDILIGEGDVVSQDGENGESDGDVERDSDHAWPSTRIELHGSVLLDDLREAVHCA